jgi:hypothetical protein
MSVSIRFALGFVLGAMFVVPTHVNAQNSPPKCQYLAPGTIMDNPKSFQPDGSPPKATPTPTPTPRPTPRPSPTPTPNQKDPNLKRTN